MSYKPKGHNAVSPYLMVKGADSTIKFLATAFDGVEILRITDDSGLVRHAEVRIDDSVLMLSDGVALGEHPPSHVHIYLPDVDRLICGHWRLAQFLCRNLQRKTTLIVEQGCGMLAVPLGGSQRIKGSERAKLECFL